MKSLFTTIKVENISFPFILKNKVSEKETTTIAGISVTAKVENIYKDEFKREVTNIISSCVSGCSLNKLLTLLLKYINSIHAVKANISCTYPYFNFREVQSTDIGYLKKYMCTLSLIKLSLLKYTKKYCVEVPVIRKGYRIPGYEGKETDISTNLFVEIEGFEMFNAEDIAETIEKYTNGNVENYTSRLGANVKKVLSANYSFEKCTVKLIDRVIRKAEIPGFNSSVIHTEKKIKEIISQEIDNNNNIPAVLYTGKQEFVI